jgi:DNA ligase D
MNSRAGSGEYSSTSTGPSRSASVVIALVSAPASRMSADAPSARIPSDASLRARSSSLDCVRETRPTAKPSRPKRPATASPRFGPAPTMTMDLSWLGIRSDYGGNRSKRRCRRTPGMAASEATLVDAGGRELRVSSPERVIFPKTERSGAVTKLDVVKYYLSVGEGIMRAVDRRPTTLERWPKGVHPGIVLSTREKGGGDAFFQKRIPRGAPDYVETARIEFPSGRHADEVCPTEVAVVGWAAQMGTITFHPWPVRREDVDHPDELRLDLDPQPGTDFADAVRVAAEARVLLDELGYAGFPKTSGGRGVHLYVRIAPQWTFTEVRHAAIAFGRELPGQVTTKWWKEERGERIFLDYNQNARDRTIASAYSVRPKPGAPVSAPLTWDELEDVAPEEFTVATMPARFAQVGDRHATIDDAVHSLTPLLDMYENDTAEGAADMPYPPDYPKMPGEPKRVQPSRDRDRPR